MFRLSKNTDKTFSWIKVTISNLIWCNEVQILNCRGCILKLRGNLSTTFTICLTMFEKFVLYFRCIHWYLLFSSLQMEEWVKPLKLWFRMLFSLCLFSLFIICPVQKDINGLKNYREKPWERKWDQINKLKTVLWETKPLIFISNEDRNWLPYWI